MNIKEEFDSSPLQDHVIALQNESMEDITNSEKSSNPDTLAHSVSEANNKHQKSPAFDSSSLDFKEVSIVLLIYMFYYFQHNFFISQSSIKL